MKKYTALAEFRVKHSTQTKLYFEVKVFETVKEMRAYGAEGGYYKRPNLGKFLGLCTTWGDESPGPKNEIGEILLCRKYLDPDVVTHECGHAAFTVMEYMKVPRDFDYMDRTPNPEPGRWFKAENEEVYCYALGDIIARMYSNLIKLGFFT